MMKLNDLAYRPRKIISKTLDRCRVNFLRLLLDLSSWDNGTLRWLLVLFLIGFTIIIFICINGANKVQRTRTETLILRQHSQNIQRGKKKIRRSHLESDVSLLFGGWGGA